MSWSTSEIFSAYITDALNNTAALDANSDALKAALFNDTITPTQNAASASTAYGAGVWAGGGVSDGANWPAVGRPLVTPTSSFTSNVYTFDADDTVSATGSTTLASVYGCLIYDDTLAAPVADQGMCFNYFGGSAGVTAGTFTILWAGSTGIFQLTL